MVGFRGIRRESTGMRLAPVAALFADSGRAIPSIVPLPNRSGWVATLFFSPYEPKEASTPPPLGGIPGKKPRMVPPQNGPS